MMRNFPEKKMADEIRDDRYEAYNSSFRDQHPFLSTLILVLFFFAIFFAGIWYGRSLSSIDTVNIKLMDAYPLVCVDFDTNTESRAYRAVVLVEVNDVCGNVLRRRTAYLETEPVVSVRHPNPTNDPCQRPSSDEAPIGGGSVSSGDLEELYQPTPTPHPTNLPTCPVIVPTPLVDYPQRPTPTPFPR